jgi:rhombotin-1/3
MNSSLETFFRSPIFNSIFSSHFRFCVGDKFYLCDNKILCEYDYEERLVFASMANHPILKRHAGSNMPNTPPSNNPNNIPTSVSSPIQQNGHHHSLLTNIAASPRSQNNDMNNNQNGLNGVSSPFGTPTHMKQVITTN